MSKQKKENLTPNPKMIKDSRLSNLSDGENCNIGIHKEQILSCISENCKNRSQEKGIEGYDKDLYRKELETKENNVTSSDTTIEYISFREDIEKGSIITDNKKKKKQITIEKVNIGATLFLSFLLVVVGTAQYMTYNRQADIAANANKLAQYQYRFEFYEKLNNLQKDVSIIKKEPQLEIEQLSELNYKILSLSRESAFLFDKSISEEINEILAEHLNLLSELNNKGMPYDDYKKEMFRLNTEYGNFINSKKFKKYLDINVIDR